MAFRFLFDEHVSKPVCEALRERGIDGTHVLDVGLAGADDAAVFFRAAEEDRIVVTRNYRDFARLVEACNADGDPFAGVLFLPVSLPQADVGAHVQAFEAWLAAHAVEHNPVRNTFGWLVAVAPPTKEDAVSYG